MYVFVCVCVFVCTHLNPQYTPLQKLHGCSVFVCALQSPVNIQLMRVYETASEQAFGAIESLFFQTALFHCLVLNSSLYPLPHGEPNVLSKKKKTLLHTGKKKKNDTQPVINIRRGG